MDGKILPQISNSDSVDEHEYGSLDLIPIDTDVDELNSHDKNLMPDPYVGEELLEDDISKKMEQFVYEFTIRYSTSGPTLYRGTLDQALTHSLFDPKNPYPLILFIYHNQSICNNVFCEQVLCAEKITDYLDKNFIVWAWDRTNQINYERLLTMLRTHLGDEVIETVISSPIDKHPMLICLNFNKGHVEVITAIEGSQSHDETLTLLMEARAKFDCRIENPDQIELHLTTVSNEGWSMSPSVLIPVDKMSEEFKQIATEFVGNIDQVSRIDKIENTLWLFQYLNQKKLIDSYFEDEKNEQLLIFPCSPRNIEQILKIGFNNDHKCIPEKKYGHGFYFLSPSAYRHSYPSSQLSKRKPRMMLVCRVLVGRTCLGNWMIETCPDEYDSTTDGLNTYIVYSNRSILPKYCIQY